MSKDCNGDCVNCKSEARDNAMFLKGIVPQLGELGRMDMFYALQRDGVEMTACAFRVAIDLASEEKKVLDQLALSDDEIDDAKINEIYDRIAVGICERHELSPRIGESVDGGIVLDDQEKSMAAMDKQTPKEWSAKSRELFNMTLAVTFAMLTDRQVPVVPFDKCLPDKVVDRPERKDVDKK